MLVDALIPALNEEGSLPTVLGGLAALRDPRLRRVVVVDNGSHDSTYATARRHGAVALYNAERGYGAACLHGLEYLRREPPDAVVFLDGDGADDPADLDDLLAPIAAGRAELVIGSRVRGPAEPGAFTPQARFGNTLACTLIDWIYGERYTDLGPFRAIVWEGIELLQMADRNFGWTVEMQVKAARIGLRATEIPVAYRRRVAGRSKVAGTVSGSLKAGAKILWTIGREALIPGPRRGPVIEPEP